MKRKELRMKFRRLFRIMDVNRAKSDGGVFGKQEVKSDGTHGLLKVEKRREPKGSAV